MFRCVVAAARVARRQAVADRDTDALRAAGLNRSETLRVPVLPSAPSPTLPGRHAPIDRLGQHFWPHVGGDVWLRLDPVVRVDPRDRVLRHQLRRLKVLVPCRFRVRLRGRRPAASMR